MAQKKTVSKENGPKRSSEVKKGVRGAPWSPDRLPIHPSQLLGLLPHVTLAGPAPPIPGPHPCDVSAPARAGLARTHCAALTALNCTH